jgi:hypothetical protein
VKRALIVGKDKVAEVAKVVELNVVVLLKQHLVHPQV